MTDLAAAVVPMPAGPTPLPHSVRFLQRYVLLHLLVVPSLLAACALGLQYGPLDMAISRLFVDATPGFALRDAGWLELLGHEAARLVPLLVGVVGVVGGIAGFRSARLHDWRLVLLTLGLAIVFSTVAINVLKARTTQQCPSTMQEFGGATPYAVDNAKPFWAGSPGDAGHCLPSGHAGGGYSLLALYFAGWASGRRGWRGRGLAIGAGAGLLFSAVRIAQGAHFASATVWSAAVCWTVCALVFLPLLLRLSTPRR